MIWEKIGLHCRHEQEISRMFGGRMRPEPDDAAVERPLLVLVFTNRSGSNYFCDCLVSTGEFEDAGEALNWDVVKNRKERQGIGSFPEYLSRHVATLNDSAKSVVLKASIRQLLMLWRHGLVGPEGLYRNVKYAHIERKDLLAQAISYSIADQTRQFTSEHKKKGSNPVYKRNDIQTRLASIIQQNSFAKEFFASVDLPVLPIVYESFISRPEQAILRVSKFTGISPLEMDNSKIRLQKQKTKINDVFKDKFRQEMTEDFLRWLEKN